MKVFYTVMTWVMFSLTMIFGLWALEEATKTMSHSWVWLVGVWTGAFALMTISFFVFRKKILSLNTGKALLANFAIILGGCALVDSAYVFDILANYEGSYSPTNQIILYALLWTCTILCIYFAARKKN